MSGINLGPGYITAAPVPSGGGGNVGQLTILSSPSSPTPISWDLNPVPSGGNGPLVMGTAGTWRVRAEATAGIVLKMWGGGGGGTLSPVPGIPSPTTAGSPGGGAGYTGGTWNITQGQTYTCVVAAGGGGGSLSTRGGAGGGGATGIDIGDIPAPLVGSNVSAVVAVAGGGGGAGVRTTAQNPINPAVGGPNGAFIGGGGGGQNATDGSIAGYSYPTTIAGVYWGGGAYWNGPGTSSGGVNSTPIPAPAVPVVGPSGPTYYRPDAPPLQNWGGHGRTGNVFSPGQPPAPGWAQGGSGSYNSYPSPAPAFYGAGGGGGGFRGGGGGGKWISPTTAPPALPNNTGGGAGGGGSGYFNSSYITGGSTLSGQGGPNPSPPFPNAARTAANNTDPAYSPVSLWGLSGLGGVTVPQGQAGNPGAIVLSLT